MNWAISTIGDVCAQTAQRDPKECPEEVFRYVDISSIDRDQKRILSGVEIIGANAPSRARMEICAGDVLVSTVRPNLNTVATVPDELDGHIASTGFCVLRPNEPTILGRFLFYYCCTGVFINALVAKVRGAQYPAVSDSDIKAIDIPLPPLSEQRRIVEILDQVDRLRRLRAGADAKAARIIPALFVEMFGDPTTNPKRWPTELLCDVGELDRGRSRHRPRNAPALLGGPYPLIQTGEVANSDGRIRHHTQTYSEVGLAQSKMWPAGTLCITIAANIAETGVLEFDACFPDSIVGFNPGPRVTTEYVQFLLGHLQAVLERSAPQVAQKNINLEVLRKIPAPIPPIALQRLFSDHVAGYYQSRRQQVEVREKLERLFSSTLTRAFSGELTITWREAHMKELLEEMEQQAVALREIRSC